MMHTFVIILITLVWGTTFFIIKDTVADVNAFFIVFSRTGIAALVMFFVLLLKNRSALLNKQAIIQGSIIGILLATQYSAQTIGLKFTSSGHSAFITSAGVILVPLFLLIFFRQKMGLPSLVAFLIVFLGLFLLTYDFQTRINIGDLITLITATGYAFHIILSGRFVKESDVQGLVFYQFLAAFIVSIAGFAMSNNEPIVLSNKSIMAIVYLGLIGTLFCYYATVWVLKYVSVLKVSIIFSLEPVFAAVFAYFAAGEILVLREIAGSLLILIGVVLYQLFPKLNKV